MTTVRTASTDDFEVIASFIAPINEINANQSLHCGIGKDEILSELKDFDSRSELLILMMFEEKELIGIIGGDTDNPLTEIWLWGPFVRQDKDWSDYATKLYDHLISNFPTIKQFTVFNNIENKQARQFYKELSYSEKDEFTHEYHCLNESYEKSKLSLESQSAASVHTVLINEKSPKSNLEQYKNDFHLLHNSAFPNPYYTTEEVYDYIQQVSVHKLWFLIFNDKLVGYLFGSVTPNNDGYVHFLAVKKDERKKGYASQLLATALKYFFEERQLINCNLTVSDKNNARSLYEKTGFHLRYTGVGARKKA